MNDLNYYLTILIEKFINCLFIILILSLIVLAVSAFAGCVLWLVVYIA